MDETDQTVTPPPWSIPIIGLLLLDILFLEKKMYHMALYHLSECLSHQLHVKAETEAFSV